jgi:enoyl-CoA hydratase/carnithine racemase
MSRILESIRDGRVLRLALNRPEKRNALSSDLCGQLADEMERAAADPSLGAILLTGHGKAFCAGMDLDEISSQAIAGIDGAQERLFTVGARLSKPIVAAVAGPALGGGTGLVANCHVVVAGENATFGLTEIRLGLWPFLVFRAISAALGERRTIELALTGRILSAPEARELGLIHQIAADPEGRAAEVAHAIAGFSPTAIQKGLEYVREASGKDGETAGEMARRARGAVLGNPDFEEGRRAFREKRTPQWPSLRKSGESPAL